MRQCKRCGETKDANSFHTNKGRLLWMCKDCVNARARTYRTPEVERRYRANKKAANPNYKVNEHLRHNYGITLETYDLLLAAQGGVCAICGSSSPHYPGTDRRFHIDHCHDSGRIRGLLCSNCNAGIGRFKDNPTFVERAATYLKTADTGVRAKRTYRWGRQSGYDTHS